MCKDTDEWWIFSDKSSQKPLETAVAHNLLSLKAIRFMPAYFGEQAYGVRCCESGQNTPLLVAGVLAELRIGGEFGRRKGEDTLVLRECLPGEIISTLVRPEIPVGVEEAETDKVGASV